MNVFVTMHAIQRLRSLATSYRLTTGKLWYATICVASVLRNDPRFSTTIIEVAAGAPRTIHHNGNMWEAPRGVTARVLLRDLAGHLGLPDNQLATALLVAPGWLERCANFRDPLVAEIMARRMGTEMPAPNILKPVYGRAPSLRFGRRLLEVPMWLKTTMQYLRYGTHRSMDHFLWALYLAAPDPEVPRVEYAEAVTPYGALTVAQTRTILHGTAVLTPGCRPYHAIAWWIRTADAEVFAEAMHQPSHIVEARINTLLFYDKHLRSCLLAYCDHAIRNWTGHKDRACWMGADASRNLLVLLDRTRRGGV